MRVLLFDIDGTLLAGAGAGRNALEDAFFALYGTRLEIAPPSVKWPNRPGHHLGTPSGTPSFGHTTGRNRVSPGDGGIHPPFTGKIKKGTQYAIARSTHTFEPLKGRTRGGYGATHGKYPPWVDA